MSLTIRWIRGVGVVAAAGLLCLIGALFAGSVRTYGFTSDFLWRQFLPIYVPYFALLILLLLPYSRIRTASIWKGLFITMVVLSLVWFVPVAWQAVAAPKFNVEIPPGEGVAAKIIITRSYGEIAGVGLIAVFLASQMLAIWCARKQTSSPSAIPSATPLP